MTTASDVLTTHRFFHECPQIFLENLANQLEKQFLEMLQYNVSISASLYASYYFELRTLCEKKNATLNMKPLGADEAKSLEARTAAFETNAKQTRKWQSMSVAEGCARSPPRPRLSR